MKKLFLDVETTGLSFREGHRILQLSALIEDDDGKEDVYSTYVNPERESDPKAYEVHKLDHAFLQQFPAFSEIASSFLEFLGNHQYPMIIAHNAKFDMSFVNGELEKCGYPKLTCGVIDTLSMAREKLKLSRYRLDDLCDYFKIDRSSRDVKHDALDDCRLLQKVYHGLSM